MELCIILVVIGSEDSFSMDITIKRYFRNIAEIQHAMYRQRIVTIAHLICFLWYHDFIDIPVYRRRDEWLTSEKCLNREREYGTMRYGRGMVTGRDLKREVAEKILVSFFSLRFLSPSPSWRERTRSVKVKSVTGDHHPWRIRRRTCEVSYRLYQDHPF